MNRTKLMTGLLASAVVIVTGLGVGTANAAPAPQIDTGTTNLMLMPLLGTPLTLTVETGPGGTMTKAELADPAGFVATEVDANKVKMTNTDGTFQLSVKSKNNEQRITAKADTIDKLAGPNTWKGGIFSTVQSQVDFTVGGTTAAPTVEVTNVAPGDGEEYTINAASTETRADGGEAKQSVTFTKDGQSRTLTIKVETHDGTAVEDDDDDSVGPSASLRITLSRPRGVAVDAATAAGDKVWSAALCDGTTATINYNLTAEGVLSVTGVSAPGVVHNSDDDEDSNANRIEVRWPTGERVRITATLSDGKITLDIKERIRCRDAADPSTNVSTSTTVDDDEGDDHEDDDSDHHGGRDDSDDDGDHHGGDDHGGEDD